MITKVLTGENPVADPNFMTKFGDWVIANPVLFTVTVVVGVALLVYGYKKIKKATTYYPRRRRG